MNPVMLKALKGSNKKINGCGKMFETEARLMDDGTIGTDFIHCESGIGLCPSCKRKGVKK